MHTHRVGSSQPITSPHNKPLNKMCSRASDQQFTDKLSGSHLTTNTLIYYLLHNVSITAQKHIYFY